MISYITITINCRKLVVSKILSIWCSPSDVSGAWNFFVIFVKSLSQCHAGITIWRFVSSRLLLRVDWYTVTDFSKEHSSFIFRIKHCKRSLFSNLHWRLRHHVFFETAGNCLPASTSEHTRRLASSATLLWEPRAYHFNLLENATVLRTSYDTSNLS